MRVGRRRTKNLNLPPRMSLKRGRYYYGRDQAFLADNLADAMLRWGEREAVRLGDAPQTFGDLANLYIASKDFQAKAPRTKRDYAIELEELKPALGSAPLSAIRPTHIAKYIEARTAKIRANREVALFSTIWNWGRSQGKTDLPNPCPGVKRNKETGRTNYVSDDALLAVYAVASEPLRDALDLYYLTGQRVADVLAMRLSDIRDGFLCLRQRKTGQTIRIAIAGDLVGVIERIQARKYPANAVVSLALVRDEQGQALTYSALVQRHRRACKAAGVRFQLRDLRAKAGTDLEDLAHAQKLLGHASRAMTEHYIKARSGDKVSPLLRTSRRIADKK